ncbi:MAG: hypothetical protein IM613_17410 [Cytophagales bacterium]|nr:hypothetical protein [Cytophagales bacterium]
MEKPFKALVIPSSDDERHYESFDTQKDFQKALRQSKRRKDSGKLFEFDTIAEREAFCKGVSAMEGNMGDGLVFFSSSEEREEALELEQAVAILKKHGYMRVLWQANDVEVRASERGFSLSATQVENVCDLIEKHHDATTGVNWEFIDFMIDEVRKSTTRNAL